eukprot:CAMPEP_0118649972 /NCGR_PEP_ID=MMETSP0785-20121206/9997_1 /TAXON_ID=91992 /ORGANISM="Bolidomonas pacifica, Strain CCMP 1866" /LENGTH=124 /DNA_ID=CAMNT_0006542313 /DNA_START=288 /DNA_END=658 /DNA_ORIENTATION=+
MKLLSHNILRNNSKEAGQNGYPLSITATEVRVTDNQFNREFTEHILRTINWEVLVEAATSIGLTTLPSTLTPSLLTSIPFLTAVHHILVNVHVVEGVLTCPKTGKEFKIQNGITDVMMEEEECA